VNITRKFPLGSTQHFRTSGVNYPMRIVGHYISDMGRECVIAISDEGIPDEEIQAGEAIVIDTLYITGQ
jgi:hypothetical protein